MASQTLSGRKYFPLSSEQRVNWLRLIRSQNVGPATFRDLINHYGTAESAIEAIPELAKRGGAAARIKIFSRQDAERELTKADAIGARLVGIGEPDFPPSLRSADAGPPLIYIQGNLETVNRKSLAIVGSRNASISGLKIASRLAAEIGSDGYTIVSGLARGIDTAAHQASIKTGTTAVFAGGIDVIFPKENKVLAQNIVENGGALVSEMPLGWQPRAKDFPKRNRIITGLSSGVLVVEAARRSGSLITARLAGEMGRLVLAIPGSPLDPRSEGTNQLIRNGAILTTSKEDVVEALSPLDAEAADWQLFEPQTDKLLDTTSLSTDLTQNTRQKIIGALGPSPVHMDDIVRYSHASPGEVQLALLELSLAGKLERHPGGLVSLI